MLKTLRSKEKTEHYEEDNTETLDQEEFPYTKTMATDIPESKVEVIAASQVTHMIPDKIVEDFTANLKFDANYPLISNIQQSQEKEEPLQVKESSKVVIKPSLSEIEPLQITEIEVNATVDEYQTSSTKHELKAIKSVIPTESFVTSEVITDSSVSELQKDEKYIQKAKSSVILKDSVGVSEQIISVKEAPLEDVQLKTSNAAVSITPLVELTVSEVIDEMKEQEVEKVTPKPATSKFNFNLLESVQIGEVFVEDKSGKYYPELIVPTETARKEISLANQVLTEIHDVQEKEGSLSALKLPPSQEANIDITSKDSLMISIEGLHEKEGELPIPELPTKVTVDKDLTLHTSLGNTITTTHIKETEFSAKPIPAKSAIVGINEHQHKFNLETNVHETESVFEKISGIKGMQANISVSVLDKNIVEEVHVNESEKDLIVKDDKYTAKADFDFRPVETIITSENVQMASLADFKTEETVANESATQSYITTNAKIITSPIVHDQESNELYTMRKPENVTQSLVPNEPLTVLETELSESENKLTLNKIPELTSATSAPSHHLKTPVSQEVTTADQIDYLSTPKDLTEIAAEYRDLHKEITVLQTTVQEQLEKLDESQTMQSNAISSFVGKESLNVTEIVPSFTEELFDKDTSKPSAFAKVELDTDRKIALTSEVTTTDLLNQLETSAPSYEEAHVSSNVMMSLQISENETFDSQILLDALAHPDVKTIAPEIIPSEETVNVTEVMQHEKEREYDGRFTAETFKATTYVTGRPVALFSELVIESSLGLAEHENIESKLKNASVENVALKELVISTTDYNEKERDLESFTKPNTASALLNLDSNQALTIEERKTETLPCVFETPSEVLWAKAKPETISKEAITQEETFVHLSEGTLNKHEPENQLQPDFTYSALQAPECDETMIIEKESLLVSQNQPDQRKADFSVIQQHGLQTSEVISQSDNLEDTAKIEIDYKTATYKIDDFIGKAANIEEVITNQQTMELSSEKLTVHKFDITPIANFTLEHTEIVAAESEVSLPEQKSIKSNVIPDFAETQALIMSTVETIEKEKDFDGKVPMPTQGASIGFIPLIGTIDTEILPTGNVSALEDKSPKSSTATITQDKLQKHLQSTEVLVTEKESSLKQAKVDLQQEATEKLIELTAKQITVIQTEEKENAIKLPTLVSTTAQPSVDEHQSLQSTEIILTDEIEDLHMSSSSMKNALTTHGIQEAVLKLQPFIGETENIFTEDIATSRLPKGKVEEQKSVHITEIVPSEAETPFDKTFTIKTETPYTKYEENTYVNVSMVTLSDKETAIKSHEHVNKEEMPSIVLESHQHVMVSDTQIREKEEPILPNEIPFTNITHTDLQPIHAITTTETLIIEGDSEFHDKLLIKNEKAHETRQITEALYNQQQQLVENVTSFATTQKPTESQANQDIISLKSVEQSEIILEEQPDTFTKYLPKDETAETKQTIINEIVHSQPDVMESASNLSVNYKSEENKVQCELELHKSYMTSESSVQELTKQIEIPESHPKVAQEQIIELKSLYQTEIITGEKLSGLDRTNAYKDEKADESNVVLQELTNTEAEVLEDAREFTGAFKPEVNKALIDVETHRSYNVTENITQEVSNEISVQESTPRQVSQQILDMKSVEQTETVIDETVSLIEVLTADQKTVDISPVEMQPVTQSDIIVHEKEMNTTFEKPVPADNATLTVKTTDSLTVYQVMHEDTEDDFISSTDNKVTAEKTITPLTHLQCTENIIDSQVDDFFTHIAPSKSTTVKTTEMSPLIVTDNVSLLHEKELHITEPKTQTIREEVVPANEVNIAEEFVAEETTPFQHSSTKTYHTNARMVEEAPEKIEIIEIPTETGETKTIKKSRKVLKKKIDNKIEITESTTIEQDGELPETIVTVSIEELPEDIQDITEETPQGKSKQCNKINISELKHCKLHFVPYIIYGSEKNTDEYTYFFFTINTFFLLARI